MAWVRETSGRAVLYVMLLLGCATALAQTLNTAAAHLKVNFIDLTWRVNGDSTTVYEQAVEREALSEQGAQAATKFAQMYNKTLQRYEVIEAFLFVALLGWGAVTLITFSRGWAGIALMSSRSARQ